MSCCAFTGNGQSSATLPPLFEQDDIVASFDFSNMGNIALTTGAHVLTSEQGPTLSFDSLQQGTTFSIVAGTGIVFDADIVSTLFTNIVATRTAAKLSYRLADFYAAFGVDAGRDYLIAAYCSTLSLPSAQVSPAGFQLGIIGRVNVPSGGADRYKCLKRNNAAGVQALGSVGDAAAGSNYTSPLPTANTKAFAMQTSPGGLALLAGEWNTAGGQLWQDVLFVEEVASAIITTVAGAQFTDQGNDVVMAFPTGQVTGDMLVHVQRLVIRSPR